MKKSKKKVSIIVPVYNVEKYIDKCLDCLVHQTLSDIEIIVINDGSPDNSDKIIQKYIKGYPDLIKYIVIENGGVANARNVGLDNAVGEYIGFCDSDDYAEKNMYELLYDKAINTKSDIIVSGYYSENHKGNISNNALDDMSEYSKSLEENPNLLLVSNPFITNKIFSRKMLDDNGIRFKKYRIFEDLLFCYSAFLIANKIDKVNKPLYHYIRRANESVTGSLNSKFYDLFPVMEELRDFYEKNSKINFNDYLTYIAIHHAYLRFTPSIKFKQIGLKYRYIRDTYKFLDDFDPNWKSNMYFSLKKRKGKIYRTKLFWFLVPILKKIRAILIKIRKKTSANYGRTFIRYSKKPILDKAILFESQKGNDINGNMFYLIKELRNNHKYDDYFVNICVNKNRINEFKSKLDFYNIKNYNLVINNSKKYIKHLARDKYLFTDTSFPIYFKKREGQVYLNTWHGTPLKYLGRSVAYEYYDISNVMKNFLIADYILYPNKFMRDVMLEDYMLDIRNNKVLMLGYPRNSIFFEKNEKSNKQKIAYLPTWRGTKSSIGGKNYIEDLSNILKEIDSGLNDNQELYVNLHPFLKGKLDMNSYEKIKLFPKEYETYDFLNSCDILITDYSSVFFDFANTKKKIILFTYDKDAYLKDRGMYLDIDDLPFEKVYTVSELLKEINNKSIVKYDKFLKEYCSYDGAYVPEKILSLVLNDDSKNLELILNKKNVSSTLVESNSFLNYRSSMELKKIIVDYKGDKEFYLGFLNSRIAKNKEYLNEFKRNIHFFGYFGVFEYTSLYEALLLILLRKSKNIYNTFKKRFDHIFVDELDRRYGNVSFSDILLYKESNVLNIYLYSFINAKKVIVFEKIPNINLDILDKYDKIVVMSKKDKDILSKCIDVAKISLISEFDINKFL